MYGWDAIIAARGVPLMLVGMLVVFSALLLLMFMMKLLRWVQETLHNRMMRRKKGQGEPEIATGEIPGVEIAAIALSIILEEESIHDQDSMVLTLQSLPKPYNNWWMNNLVQRWPAPEKNLAASC